MMTTKTMGRALIGPASWRNQTIREVSQTELLAKRTAKSISMGRKLDPLPHMRDVARSVSNNEAHRYFRQTRLVVNYIRECLLDINEEIKVLTNSKDSMERHIEHIRKDIQLNKDNVTLRSHRPVKEQVKDGADALLFHEKQSLFNMKRTLENHLKLMHQQLQDLAKVRKQLFALCQERTRVLDLICHSVQISTAPSTCRIHVEKCSDGSVMECRTASPCDDNELTMDALGALTPEVSKCFKVAVEAIHRAAVLRKDGADIRQQCTSTQQCIHNSVSESLVQKIAESVTLKQNLSHASAVNRDALHKSLRWYEHTDIGWQNTQGPASSSFHTTREKLNRPIVSVFQRHPGNELPEARELTKGSDDLLDSLQNTSRNIAQLRLQQQRIESDARDKSIAIRLDGDTVRERRRKQNHRWAMKAAFCP